MEANYMIAGHSAGAAAALAAKDSVSVHNVNLDKLQDGLRTDGQILHLEK
jgi:malonyl CoA-acyl carrier protein transacylase